MDLIINSSQCLGGFCDERNEFLKRNCDKYGTLTIEMDFLRSEQKRNLSESLMAMSMLLRLMKIIGNTFSKALAFDSINRRSNAKPSRAKEIKRRLLRYLVNECCTSLSDYIAQKELHTKKSCPFHPL